MDFKAINSWKLCFLFFRIICFISGCAGCSWLLRLFSSSGERGLLSSFGAWAFHSRGFLCWRARALGCVGSSCSSIWVQ